MDGDRDRMLAFHLTMLTRVTEYLGVLFEQIRTNAEEMSGSESQINEALDSINSARQKIVDSINECAAQHPDDCTLTQRCVLEKKYFYAELSKIIKGVKTAASGMSFRKLPKFDSGALQTLSKSFSKIVDRHASNADTIRKEIVDGWTGVMNQWMNDNFVPFIGEVANQCHSESICTHPDQTAVYRIVGRMPFLLNHFRISHLNGHGDAIRPILSKLWKNMLEVVNKELLSRSFADFLHDGLQEHPWTRPIFNV